MMTNEEGLDRMRKAIEWMQEQLDKSVLDVFTFYYVEMITQLNQEAEIFVSLTERDKQKEKVS